MTILLNDEYVNIPWDDIVRVEPNIPGQEDIFSVFWILGRFCNYSCSYCYDFGHTDKLDHLPFQTYIEAVDMIKYKAREIGYNKFYINFSGGEPTAYKRFHELVKHYVDDPQSDANIVVLTTNLSPSIKWWQKLIDIVGAENLRITASFHHEFADFNEFTEKVLYLHDHNVKVNINQVMEGKHFNDGLDRLEKWNKLQLSATAKAQKNKQGNRIMYSSYTDEMLEILKRSNTRIDSSQNNQLVQQDVLLTAKDGSIYYLDESERFNNVQKNVFTGWKCHAGHSSIVIKQDGIVRRAHSCSNEILGNIQVDFDLFKTPLPCKSKICVTSTDTKITKWREPDGPPIGTLKD